MTNPGYHAVPEELRKTANVLEQHHKNLVEQRGLLAQSNVGPSVVGKPFADFGERYRAKIDALEEEFQNRADEIGSLAKKVSWSSAEYVNTDAGQSAHLKGPSK